MKTVTASLLVLGVVLVGLSACSGLNPVPTAGSSPVETQTIESQLSTAAPRTATALPPTATPSPVPTLTETATVEPSPTEAPTPAVLAGAGDISVCGHKGDDQTAELLAGIPGTVFTAGDNSNESGELFQYQDCFGPSWGQFMDRIHPSAGNHDFYTRDGEDYFQYFGMLAGEPGQGYYSYDLGDWHIVVLNSNCNAVGCGFKSNQVEWLQADLDAHPSRCSLAYWHHPRFSSGLAGTSGLYPFWQVLYDHGVELVVNGNDHDYERFSLQDPDGNPDPEKGIRQFVVGTGGASQRSFALPEPNSEVRNSGAYGVIKLSLYSDRYEWEFLPVVGETFTDTGSTPCH